MTKVQQDSEGSGGNWIPNLINWFIGYIMIGIWMPCGQLFGLIGDWQTGLDAIQAIPADYAPAGAGDAYLGDLVYEV